MIHTTAYWSDEMTERFEELLKSRKFSNRKECFELIAKEMKMTMEQVKGKFYRNLVRNCELGGFKTKRYVADDVAEYA